MTPLAFVLIVTSAGLHASWHMIAKKNHLTLVFYTMLLVVGAVLMSWVRFVTPVGFFGQPKWFYIWLSISCAGDLLYGISLTLAYRRMDMSSAYPMMRSLPLLLTAILTTLCGWGKPLSILAMIGMAVVFAGCLAMPLAKFSDFKLRNYFNRGILFILTVACGTTLYTIFDSLAMGELREALPDVPKTMISMSYYEYRASTLVVLFSLAVLATKHTRQEALELWRSGGWKMSILAGCFSTGTYVLVLLAMNYVSNVSYVQGFRQIGLLIGMFEGIFILKERPAVPKFVGLALILSGLALTLI